MGHGNDLISKRMHVLDQSHLDNVVQVDVIRFAVGAAFLQNPFGAAEDLEKGEGGGIRRVRWTWKPSWRFAHR